ncbi:MAG: transcriptional regulator [Actinomycetia bacterium]|nr:transcriptional regulator [Actinomycetes bacterium]
MRVASAVDLGGVVRARRKRLGWTQQELADRAGTSRQWMVALEGGKGRAELGLVLKALNALGLTVDLTAQDAPAPRPSGGSVDLDALLAAYRRDR